MDKTTLLQNAINFAKQNPDSPEAQELRKRIESGMYRAELNQIKQAKNVANVPETSRTFVEKVAGFTGGEQISQGLGQALANQEISKSIEETQKSQFEIQGNLIKAIKDKTAMGQDTSRLENALKLLNEDISNVGQGAEKLMNQKELTTKQVVGDALQLATTAAAGKVAGAIAGKTTGTAGVLKSAIQGAKTGAISGVALGGSEGVASGLKEDKSAREIVGEGVKGALLGGTIGGVLGAGTGAIVGKINTKKFTEQTVSNHLKTAKMQIKEMSEEQINKLGGKSKLFEQNKKNIVDQLRAEGLDNKADIVEKVSIRNIQNIDDYENAIRNSLVKQDKVTKTALKAVTPDTKSLSSSQYEDLLNKGRISPKTKTQPSQYILSDRERNTALKYKKIFTNDPVKDTDGILDEIYKKDVEVGKFLKDNNRIFNTGELKNNLTKKLANLDDLTVSDEKLIKVKGDTIDNFLKSLKKNDMETLWKARKAYDSQIERAFKGSPSLSKEIKKEFRNAIQDFIAEKTPNDTYKNAMKEMSDLFNLKDLTNIKAQSEKGLNAIQLWIKRHPTRTKVIGTVAGTGALTGIGASLIK